MRMRLGVFVAVLVLAGCGSSQPQLTTMPLPPPPPAGQAPTPLGRFSWIVVKSIDVGHSTPSKLPIGMPYMTGGGSFEVKPHAAPAGRKLLLVVFEPATKHLMLEAPDLTLRIPGNTQPQQPIAVCGAYTSIQLAGQKVIPNAVFSMQSLKTAAAPGTRMAAAFEVDAGTGSGTLTVRGVSNAVSW